ncbi:MAG: nucleotidyltransferase domain-containing protein [Thermoleophilia bacterium]
MDLGAPHRIISGRHDLDIVRVLVASRGSMSGRRVARMAGVSHGTAQRVLTRLADAGLLDVETVGRAYAYRFNRDHLAAGAIESLVALRPRLIDALRLEMEGLSPGPRAAVVFGSTARGDGDIDSDIDILLVRPPGAAGGWDDQLAATSERIRRISGNHLSIHLIDEEALEQLEHDRPPIVGQIRRDGVDLAGTPIRDLLGPGSARGGAF